ncbi:conserved hypothetical protein [Pseudomonas chlororaphis]
MGVLPQRWNIRRRTSIDKRAGPEGVGAYICQASLPPGERLWVPLCLDKANQVQAGLTYRVAPAYYWNVVPVRTMLLTFTSLSKISREKYESRQRCC